MLGSKSSFFSTAEDTRKVWTDWFQILVWWEKYGGDAGIRDRFSVVLPWVDERRSCRGGTDML